MLSYMKNAFLTKYHFCHSIIILTVTQGHCCVSMYLCNNGRTIFKFDKLCGQIRARKIKIINLSLKICTTSVSLFILNVSMHGRINTMYNATAFYYQLFANTLLSTMRNMFFFSILAIHERRE